MSVFNSRERVRRLFRREPLDTMPVFSGMGMVTIQAIRKMEIHFPQVHKSAEYMARAALTSAEIFGFDAVVIPYDMCTVPEALGRGVSLYEDSEDILYPTVPTKWETLEAVEIPENYLSLGRMPLVDKAFGLLKAQSDQGLAIGGWVLGPFTMAGQLLELDFLLKGIRKDKERIEAFLATMTDLVIEVAQHYQALGLDYITIREMGSGTDLLSPRMWTTIIEPNLKRLFAAIQSPKILHICGSTDLIIEMMNNCGADALSVDQKNNLALSRKKLGNAVLLLGNFDPYRTLVQMDPSQVESIIKKCIDDGADAVWPGCDLWPDVNEENLKVALNTIKTYGRKPSPAVGRL